MQVSKEAELSESLVATGFPSDQQKALPANMKGVQELIPQVRNLRIAGSAALHMAYVAAGRLSGFWEIGLNVWDIAAGSLLIQESGGRVTDTTGRSYTLDVRNVMATNGYIHEELEASLRAAQGTGF